jgi:predicted PurR-regulated permease PerM
MTMRSDLSQAVRLLSFIVGVVVVAILYIARDVFLPLGLAILIAFMLSPAVAALRRRGVPRGVSVVMPVVGAFAVIGSFGLILVLQFAQIAQQLPEFQSNIVAKIETLKESGASGGLIDRLSRLGEVIGKSVERALPNEVAAGEAMPVRVVGSTSLIDTAEAILVPLVAPLATAGLVVVVVIFMLLDREQLRDRLIRLIGAGDLVRTTRMLEDAAGRVSTYLLIQLLVNVIYAVPIALGLWLIGVPNPLLWGMITLVFRFVPYIGSFLSAAFPLLMAFAAMPGWSGVLWTAALFGLVEFITSNIIEPQLYGSRTGLSPVAVIVSAIFWTFLWGPLGLVISTPLTVCLVVLGRHVPQFALFDILFGDEAVLAPHAQFYQRLLAGDAVEALARADDEVDGQGPVAFLGHTAIPALLLAQRDRESGALDASVERRFAQSMRSVLKEMDLEVEAPLAGTATDADGSARTVADGPAPVPTGRVACIGGRWSTDEVSAWVLAHALAAQGMDARTFGAGEMVPPGIAKLGRGDCIMLCFLDPEPSRASLLRLRRLRRVAPEVSIGVVIWSMPDDLNAAEADGGLPSPSTAKFDEARALGADFTVSSLPEALREVGARIGWSGADDGLPGGAGQPGLAGSDASRKWGDVPAAAAPGAALA